jgi:hypothetical protein
MEVLALVLVRQPNSVAYLERLDYVRVAHCGEVRVIDLNEPDELLDAALSQRSPRPLSFWAVKIDACATKGLQSFAGQLSSR